MAHPAIGFARFSRKFCQVEPQLYAKVKAYCSANQTSATCANVDITVYDRVL